MTVTSFEYAARKNGVAPTSDCQVGLPPPRKGSFDTSLAFTFAPWSRIIWMRSKKSRLSGLA